MAFVDYDKVVLFGDSITEQSYEQTRLTLFPAPSSAVAEWRDELTEASALEPRSLMVRRLVPRVLKLTEVGSVSTKAGGVESRL